MNHNLAREFIYFLQFLRKEPVRSVFNELKKTEKYSREQLLDLQMQRLKKILEYAYQESPYYKKSFDEASITVKDIQSLDDLKKLPIVTKKILQENYKELECKTDKPFTVASTSGSTGDPWLLKRDNVSWAYLHANLYRLHTWHGIPVGARYLNITGYTTGISKKIRSGLKEFVFNRINLSAVDMRNDTLEKYMEKIDKFKPRYIFGYPSAIADLAGFIKAKSHQDKVSSITHIICHGEELEDGFRKTIESGFNSKIVNQYGCGELGMVAMECEEGNMHFPIESIVIEEVDGELVLTDLHNFVAPLIRYNIGDIAQVSYEPCSCGRAYPMLKNLEGKRRAIIETPDGKRVHTVFFNILFRDLFKEGFKIERYQIIQKDKATCDINLILSQELSDDLVKKIQHEIKEKFGSSMKFNVNKVDQLIKRSSGKLAAFIKEGA